MISNIFKKGIFYLYNKITTPFFNTYFNISYTYYNKLGKLPSIDNCEQNNHISSVDKYWNWHTVYAKPFLTTKQSERYIEWRFDKYPLFRELSQLYNDYSNKTILDYGCGPGNDIMGFLLYSNPKRVIGLDISEKALRFAQHRIALHRIDTNMVKLIRISDNGNNEFPLENNSISFFSSQGVIHHTSNPNFILRELFRVLEEGAEGCIMVYNYNSVWLHLYTAYQRMIVNKDFKNLDILEAFSKNTDGEDCPISHCYKPQEFIEMCEKAGFKKVEFIGGYLSEKELEMLDVYYDKAIKDSRLAIEHRDFLNSLSWDENGYPLYNDFYAGIGGIYRLKK